MIARRNSAIAAIIANRFTGFYTLAEPVIIAAGASKAVSARF